MLEPQNGNKTFAIQRYIATYNLSERMKWLLMSFVKQKI